MNSMSRRELLAKLIKTLHLSVDERRQVVLPITAAELEAIVVQELIQEDSLSNPVGSIVKLATGEYQLYREVETGIGQYQEVRLVFPHSESAANEFVRWIVQDYPVGEIDGLKISDETSWDADNSQSRAW